MATTTRNRSDNLRKKSLDKQPATTALPQSTNGNGAPPSDGDIWRQLYLGLLKCRMAGEHVQRRSSSTAYDFAIGLEAVVVGSVCGLRAEDTVTASSRNLAARIARGKSIKSVLQQGDTEHSCSHGLGCIIAPTCLPADPFMLATGIALTHKIEQKRNVVVALCPEQSSSLDRWREALKFAGAHKLPILFVVGGAASSPSSSGTQNTHLEDFSFMARGFDFPGIIVDGGDVVAVWRVAQESLHRARNGSGPTLIDCRMESPQDPLAHMEHYMRKRSVWDDDWKRQAAKAIQTELAAAL
jgi:TPP-dependent pyruvate/acetoin dehydrogenase alpha subunit